MPFADGRFEVVLNRHEAYDAAEVRRVLSHGDRFLTQQVDGRDFADPGDLRRQDGLPARQRRAHAG